jgi:hypothetical protein
MKPKKTPKPTAPETSAVETTEPKPAEAKAATKSAKKAKGKAEPKRSSSKKTTAMPKARASESLVVFAFRLTPAERDVIHDAAGPAKASRFVRAVALAAARRDVGALQSILMETQEAKGG